MWAARNVLVLRAWCTPGSVRWPSGDRLRSHHTLFWAAAICVSMIAYGDVVFGGKTFIPIGYVPSTYGMRPFAAGYHGRPAPQYPEVDAGAEAWFVHPLAYHERRALAAGTLPFWNRHNGLGWPMLSDGQIALYNPLHWIELLNPDWPVLWDLHSLLLRILGGAFTCYLLYRLGAPPALAALGAPVAAVHGSFTALVARADLNAYALMPALLYCLVRLRQERDGRSAAAFGVVLYLVLTAGHPQPSASVLISSALVAVALIGWPRDGGVTRYLSLAAISSAVVALLSAPYWLPFFRHLQRSWTIHPPGLGEAAAPPAVALQWLVPGIVGRTSLTAFLDRPLQASTFIGGVAGTLALLGIAAPLTVKAARWRLGLVAVPALLALKLFGFPPLRFLGKVPLLERMPFSYFGFAILFLAAVCGVLAIGDLAAVPRRTRLFACATVALVVIVVIGLAPAYASQRSIAGGLPSHFPFLLVVYGMLSLCAMALAYCSATAASAAVRHACIAALGALLVAELTAYRYRLSDRGNPTAAAPFVQWLQQKQGASPPFRVMGLGDWLNPNLSTAFGLEDVRMCDALVAPEYMAFVRRYFQRDLQYGWFLHASPRQEGFRVPAGMLNLLNVRYVISYPDGIEDYIAQNRIAYADREMRGGVVIENLAAWPRIFAVQQPHVESSAEAALERLGKLDAARPFAVVATDFPAARWSALCRTGCAANALEQRISDITAGVNDLSFRAAVDGPAVLVVSDAMADGWRAFVDGVEQPIFRANVLFRGLILERGEHTVRFAFRPPGWAESLWLAAAGMCACAAMVLAAALRRTRVVAAATLGNLADG